MVSTHGLLHSTPQVRVHVATEKEGWTGYGCIQRFAGEKACAEKREERERERARNNSYIFKKKNTHNTYTREEEVI